MRTNVSAWSIRNPTAVVLAFILLTIAGLHGFRSMKVQNFPDIDLPIVTVSAMLPGASPTQLENDVARKLENAMATLQGLRHLDATISDGQVAMTVEFRIEKPQQEALDDVRDAVARVRADLPPELRDPVIRKVELAGAPMLAYTVASPRLDDDALSWLVDRDITRRLLAVPGVGAVTRVGGVTREVRVELDPARLLALRTTAAEVSRRLRLVHQEASGGRADLGGAEQRVRTLATVASAAELAAMHLPLADGRRIRLDEVASVRDTTAERRSAALLDGAPVVGFEVVRARGAGEVEVAHGVRAALERLGNERPDLHITEALDVVAPVVENVDGSMMLLYEGALLAVLVVFAFLRDVRATFIAAVALPLSIIPTFAVLHAMGFTINTVSLLALSLVVGVLVDDAIVEIENIERHLHMGKPPYRAAMDASDEIGLAVIATTFTLIAVFVPTSLMAGVVGRYFVQFGWTAAIAVFFSLVVARMLTPMMAAYLLRPPTRAPRDARWLAAYLTLARRALRHRAATLATTLALLVGGAWLATTLPGEFIPADDGAHTQVTLMLPPGTRLHDTIAASEHARTALRDVAHVRSVYTTIGGGSAGQDPTEPASAPVAGVGSAVLTVNLAPRREREGITRQAIEADMRRALAAVPGARVKVGMGGSGENHLIALASEDTIALERHAARVERELRTINGVGAVTSSLGAVAPELVVRPDAPRAARLGVTSAAIAETLRVATLGDYDEELARLDLGERQVPVVVRLPDHARTDLDLLGRLSVAGAHGPVPLASVASLHLDGGPATITRRDRMRNVTLEVELAGRPLGEVEAAAEALPSLSTLPKDVVHGSAGDAEVMGELVSGFLLAMGMGVLCVYAVLVLLLRDFAQPVTILAALVLSIPGAFLALAITASSLSMPAMIGLIMLMGITTKNAILLVDYIVIARREGDASRDEAILDACRKRARPIVMTTLAMGAGMLPVALGWGADPSFRAPMAIVVIGGLVTSTVLSLLVVPVVYALVDDGVAWLKRRVARRLPVQTKA